jgi:hypothetical protein
MGRNILKKDFFGVQKRRGREGGRQRGGREGERGEGERESRGEEEERKGKIEKRKGALLINFQDFLLRTLRWFSRF